MCCDPSAILDIAVAIISLLDIPVTTTTDQETNQNKMSDSEEDKLPHPDSAIRLASAVHRFKVPIIDPDQKISFAKSFKTTGTHPKTKNLMLKVSGAWNFGRLYVRVRLFLNIPLLLHRLMRPERSLPLLWRPKRSLMSEYGTIPRDIFPLSTRFSYRVRSSQKLPDWTVRFV
jgi:hypothetical protein